MSKRKKVQIKVKYSNKFKQRLMRDLTNILSKIKDRHPVFEPINLEDYTWELVTETTSTHLESCGTQL